MRRSLALVTVALAAAMPAAAGTLKCPPDSVQVGNACIDRYEASVWQIAPTNASLVKKVQAGKATLADLTGGGATQLGLAPSCAPSYPANFPDSGQWTPVLGSSPPSPGLYSVSIPGVIPSACVTWFQAAQACRLSGKRLLTNLEWQDAAAGTPDPGTDNGTTDCNVSSVGPVNTGSRSLCKSNWGVFDMVGNAEEWVADWAERSFLCTDWTTQTSGIIGGGDTMCMGRTVTGFNQLGQMVPGALIRGGYWSDGSAAGVFTVLATVPPHLKSVQLGFRCVR